MSNQYGEMKEKNKDEEYFYRFDSILIPIIPTIIIIIMGILFRKFSSKNKKYVPKKEEKKEKDNKGSLLGGNPRYKQDNTKKENKPKFKTVIEKNEKEILNSLIKSDFFMSFFKSINKYKGFTGKEIENIFKENEKEIKIDDYFFLGDFSYLKKYKQINKNDGINKDNILIYYLNSDKNEKQSIYNKNDIIKDNEILWINYNSKEIKLLLPKQNYNKQISDDELLKELLNSWCIKNIYKIFSINSDNKIGLSKTILEKGNKYNLYLINNYISTKNKIEKEENKEIKSNSDEKKDYVFNNVNPKNVINISNSSTQVSEINNKSSIIQNESVISTSTNNESNVNKNIIINECKNDNQNQYQNQNNQNQNQINNNNNNNTNNNNNNNTNMNMNNIYIFPLVGLNNVGSTCFMNATLQCLLHISELNSYFINEYPNDFKVLANKNASAETHGNIAMAYFNVVQGVYYENIQYTFNNNYYMNRSYAPREFKETLGNYNSQFRFYEANDSKDLILYLLQTFHEELNYFGDVPYPLHLIRPNQENRVNTFNYFMTTYNMQNFSIVSKLFYGTYENTIKCCNCNKVYFSYQKFEFISFSTYNYRNSTFNIYDGFRDNQATQYLRGNNQYFCPSCQCLHNGETCCKIIQPPNKLIINIDYGKNKINKVNQLIFDEIIDITQFVNFNFGKNIIYQICGVCTHLGSSGPTGHYIAYCRNKLNGLWYNFNDSSVRQCDKREIYNGSPYLLLYEQIS